MPSNVRLKNARLNMQVPGHLAQPQQQTSPWKQCLRHHLPQQGGTSLSAMLTLLRHDRRGSGSTNGGYKKLYATAGRVEAIGASSPRHGRPSSCMSPLRCSTFGWGLSQLQRLNHQGRSPEPETEGQN